MRIGAWDEEGYSLTSTNWIAVDSEGRIFVAQPSTATVQVYSGSGEYLATLGGRGAGPGEFSMLSPIGVRGSELWVTDTAHQRLTFFDSDLRYVRTLPFRNVEVAPGNFVGGAVPLADGTFGLVGMRRGQHARMPILRVDSPGVVVDTLLHISTENTGIQRIGTVLMSLPLQDFAFSRSDPRGRGIVIVDRRADATNASQPKITITRKGVPNSPSFTLEIPNEPVPLTAARIEEFVQLGQGVIPSSVISSSDLTAAYANFDHIPSVSGLALGTDGSIWIAREDLGPAYPRKWEIFDEGGTACGSLYLAQEDVVVWADYSELWVTSTDELDVPFLIKYRLERRGDLCRSGTTAPAPAN